MCTHAHLHLHACMCAHTCMRTRVHMYICTCMHTRAHLCRTSTRICTHMYARTRGHVYSTCMRVHARVHVWAPPGVRVPVCMHVYVCTCTFVCMHMHVHVHMCVGGQCLIISSVHFSTVPLTLPFLYFRRSLSHWSINLLCNTTNIFP